jgi:hypothetical protein
MDDAHGQAAYISGAPKRQRAFFFRGRVGKVLKSCRNMNSSHDSLDALRAGDHLCFPYETEDDKRSASIAFIRDGLGRHERCLYIGAPDDQRQLIGALEAAGVPATRALGEGALVVATQAEVYLRTGTFDPQDTLEFIDGLIDGALADGFSGLRGTGEASGPVPDELWPRVVWYEAQVNERFARRPFVALCRFHASDMPPEHVQDVLRTHPLAMVRDDLCANPFYERPELAVSDDTRARVDWQLHQLRTYHRTRKHQDRFLTVLADELAEPLFALKRELHALLAGLDDTPSPERIEAANRHLRQLSTVVDRVRDRARLAAQLPRGPRRPPADSR